LGFARLPRSSKYTAVSSAAVFSAAAVFSFSDDSVLEILDTYEEFDPENTEQSLFIRTKVPATLPTGRILDCWVSVYNRNPQNARILPDGDYSQFAAIRHPRPHS
jgi:gamma-glutamylcyclotransferase (GGCT)/AIG2-like uncharacterized protein YtfP